MVFWPARIALLGATQTVFGGSGVRHGARRNPENRSHYQRVVAPTESVENHQFFWPTDVRTLDERLAGEWRARGAIFGVGARAIGRGDSRLAWRSRGSRLRSERRLLSQRRWRDTLRADAVAVANDMTDLSVSAARPL